MTDPSIREVAVNPEWIPHAFEADSQVLTSVFVPVAQRKDLVFLTDGQFRGRLQKVTFPLSSLAAESAAAAEAPLCFIFHTSFCCSTLLAKAMEATGRATRLSEPNVLVNLAEQAIAKGSESIQAKLDLALHLLARPLECGQTIVVKPSSFANRLIEPILEVRPGSRGVLLYSDAETFLGSVVRRGLLGKINARRLYRNLDAWASLNFGFSPAETFEQTDLQIAALAWLMQIAHFHELTRQYGSERLIVLDAADLLAKPSAELGRVQAFFGFGLDDGQVQSIVGGPVFSKHSKFSDQDYDSHSRETERNALLTVHAEELRMVLEWLNAVAGHLGVPLRPGSAT